MGTPHYMSPEQATGDNGAVDGRSDIYSLGCVLYELLAGKPPFSGTTPLAILARRITESPPDLRQVRPVVPAGIAEAVQRAMARLPEDRFASVAGFSAALQAFNSTISNGQRRTWPRRLAGVAVIAICAIAVGTAASQWLRARSTAISGLDANLLAVHPSMPSGRRCSSGARAWWTYSREASMAQVHFERWRQRSWYGDGVEDTPTKPQPPNSRGRRAQVSSSMAGSYPPALTRCA